MQGPVRVQSFRGGVELSATFVAGPYQYTQLWRFHDDGRLCPWLTIYGPGVHDQHTYHPHFRFDFDLDGARDDAFERFEDGRWQRVEHEGWFPYSRRGRRARQRVAPGRLRLGRGDQHPPAQLGRRRGVRDPLPRRRVGAVLAAQRGAAAQPFPAAYVGDEALDGDDVTLWYVAHVHFDQSFPYTAGPWIKVEGLG